MTDLKIAIAFTCHNRLEKTKKCMESLYAQDGYADHRIRFFVCDDGSTDGTYEFLKSLKDLEIIRGDGELYWNKGMAKALSIAEKWTPDFYLMVNDDVVFYNDMLNIMLSACTGKEAVTGATWDPEKNRCSYSGINTDYFEYDHRVKPEHQDRRCQYANWNCFLLPAEIYDVVGRLDEYYEHAFGDYDYSFRMRKMGYSIIVSPSYIGDCFCNARVGTSKDTTLGIWKRIQLKNSRKESPPKSRWHFYWKQNKLTCIYWFFRPYIRIVSSSLKAKKKYRKNKMQIQG